MRHIIHDWDDAKSTLILKNIRQVLPAARPRAVGRRDRRAGQQSLVRQIARLDDAA